MKSLRSYAFGPASGGKPKQLVVLLHGLGADGQDLLGLAPLYAAALPDAVFVAPDAPFPCDMAPMGYQWFSLQEWTPESILRGVQESAPVLDNFLSEQLAKYGLDSKKAALVGFSQGTMMSLYAGPRFSGRLGGILGYSGALVWEDKVDVSLLHRIPVHLIHGTADTVVPIFAYYHAKEKLEQAGFTVTGGVTHGLMHNIDPAGIESGAQFLKNALI